MNLQDTKNKLAKLGIGLRPILFSTPMVQAIIYQNKTQTRREVKFNIPKKGYRYDGICEDDKNNHWMWLISQNLPFGPIKCPYGKPGDILWVREKFAKLIDENSEIYYSHFADDPTKDQFIENWQGWKPSIHMPFEAGRIFLRIKSIAVERLNDISEDDARAEGLIEIQYKATKSWTYNTDKYPNGFGTAKGCFVSLWNSINGPESWSTNPWVWIIKFERISLSDIYV